METYEIVNSNKKTLIPLLKSLKIDIDYCCDSTNVTIYTYPEKTVELTARGYHLIHQKILSTYK